VPTEPLAPEARLDRLDRLDRCSEVPLPQYLYRSTSSASTAVTAVTAFPVRPAPAIMTSCRRATLRLEKTGASGEPVLLRLRGVSKAYEDGGTRHDVLNALDLDVAAGEMVALLGPSGSGKSTLLNIVAGIDAADAGKVEFGGRDIAAMGERERTLLRRREIGFVFQFFNLIPTLTVRENVQLPLELIGARGAVLRERADALLGRVGLVDRGRSFPDELSGGEQQRTAIARALAHEPSLILADEPTGNLDGATGGRVLDLLAELAHERGTTMLVATHSDEVVRRADRVVALRDGRVA
jgi:putative ABC transport system ATP-binding protein